MATGRGRASTSNPQGQSVSRKSARPAQVPRKWPAASTYGGGKRRRMCRPSLHSFHLLHFLFFFFFFPPSLHNQTISLKRRKSSSSSTTFENVGRDAKMSSRHRRPEMRLWWKKRKIESKEKLVSNRPKSFLVASFN